MLEILHYQFFTELKSNMIICRDLTVFKSIYFLKISLIKIFLIFFDN